VFSFARPIDDLREPGLGCAAPAAWAAAGSGRPRSRTRCHLQPIHQSVGSLQVFDLTLW